MRKPAPLAAGVLLKKGEAAPMSDSQGRDGPMGTGSHAPSHGGHVAFPGSHAAPHGTQAALHGIHAPPPGNHVGSPHVVAEPPGKTRTADLEPLGFKVPPQFNQDFRRFAFENGYKLNELLFAAFEAFKKSRIRESANS
jgi:hypothetical protein